MCVRQNVRIHNLMGVGCQQRLKMPSWVVESVHSPNCEWEPPRSYGFWLLQFFFDISCLSFVPDSVYLRTFSCWFVCRLCKPRELTIWLPCIDLHFVRVHAHLWFCSCSYFFLIQGFLKHFCFWWGWGSSNRNEAIFFFVSLEFVSYLEQGLRDLPFSLASFL